MAQLVQLIRDTDMRTRRDRDEKRCGMKTPASSVRNGANEEDWEPYLVLERLMERHEERGEEEDNAGGREAGDVVVAEEN